jgi:hypothetical protein
MTTSARHGSRPPSRRAFLVGGGLSIAAATGCGIAAAASWPRSTPTPPPGTPPAQLVTALAAEHELIATLDASAPRLPQLAVLIAQIRANHAEHATALAAALQEATGAGGTPSAAPTSSAPRALDAAGLRAAEQQAATAAAVRAAALAGRDATVLACIAACEATHAELLT